MDRVHLTTWVDRQLKEQFSAVARAQGLSESALLRRLVSGSVVRIASADELIGPVKPLPEGGRISGRLRAEDGRYDERADQRGQRAKGVPGLKSHARPSTA